MSSENCKMNEYSERDFAVYGGLWKLREEEDIEKGRRHIAGTVDHKLGVVVFSQYHSWPTEHRHSCVKERRFLKLVIIHNGRWYTRRWEARYGDKTIVRLANEFIEEVKG